MVAFKVAHRIALYNVHCTGHLKFVDFGTAKDFIHTDLNGPEFVGMLPILPVPADCHIPLIFALHIFFFVAGTPEYLSPSTVRSMPSSSARNTFKLAGWGGVPVNLPVAAGSHTVP